MSKDKNGKGNNEKSKGVPTFDHALPPVKSSTPMPKVKPLKEDE
ncbi:hypothetical protein [Pseudomonas sp. FW300-N1A1]|nr:hypothetical protein [Pseudomonas sp. FW300-N1A1]